jgi:hypothetical protein
MMSMADLDIWMQQNHLKRYLNKVELSIYRNRCLWSEGYTVIGTLKVPLIGLNGNCIAWKLKAKTISNMSLTEAGILSGR